MRCSAFSAIDPCLIIISDSEFPATERASPESARSTPADKYHDYLHARDRRD